MKLIICALIIALIVVTVLLVKNKLTVYMLTMWMVENDYPTPEKEDGERMGRIIFDRWFKR